MRSIVTKLRWKLARLNARRRMDAHPELKRRVQEYLKATNSRVSDASDYWQLYNHVRRHKPREILECGGGGSTIVLALAVKENGFGRVTTMEESPEWHQRLLELFPGDLKQYAEILLSPTVEDSYSIFRGIRYRDVPERPYDFVYVDGPHYETKDGDVTFDFDLLRVVSRSPAPVSAMIDKRVSTIYVMQRLLPGRVHYRPHLGLGFMMPSSARDLRPINRNTPSLSFSATPILRMNDTP